MRLSLSALPGANPGIMQSEIESLTVLKAWTRLSKSNSLEEILVSLMLHGRSIFFLNLLKYIFVTKLRFFLRFIFLVQWSEIFASLINLMGISNLIQSFIANAFISNF